MPSSPPDVLVDTAASVLAARTGLRLPAGSRLILRDAVMARAETVCGGDPGRYVARMLEDDGGDEVDRLFDRVAVGQTEFMRQPGTFRALADVVLPALASRGGPVRLVSAGCSSGEEVWTLAACAVACLGAGVPVSVTGVDWSRRALAAARRARYPAAAVAGLPDPMRRLFETSGDVVEPCALLRERVGFARRNLAMLAAGDLGGAVDVILFCNVGIYFPREVVERGMRRFHDALSPGGYLFLGHAESLWGMDHPFELVDLDEVFAYRRRSARRPALSAGGSVAAATAPTAVAAPGAPPPAVACAPRHDPGTKELVAAAQEALIRGLLDVAEAAASALADRDEFSADAQFVLGTVAERRGARDDAAGAFRRVLYLDPGFALAYFEQARLAERAGDHRRAAASYRAAARGLFDDPDRYAGYLESLSAVTLADTCERRGDALASRV